MRNIVVVCLAAALLAAGFLGGRLLPSASAPPASSAERKVLHYTCPMHPTIKSDRPGTAPCCGMALEPVMAGSPAASSSHPAGTVALDAGLRQLQGVKVGEVGSTTTTLSLRLFGEVAADERRVYAINAGISGNINEVAPVTTGSPVRRGQRLATFFSSDMRAALQGFITALDVIDTDPSKRAALSVTAPAGTTPNRNAFFTVERLRALGMSMGQLEQMREKREVPLFIDVVSPVDGYVLARNVTAGQKFEHGQEWFRVANLDKVWILADLSEADAALVRPGATAQVTVPGRAAALTAVVSQVPPTFDGESRTLKVRLELDNPGALLRPDMYVDVVLTVERPEALTVPVDAVVDTGLRKTVFVERGEGIFEPQAITTGWRADGRVEVLSGLAPGDRIVMAGTFLVDSESQLRSIGTAPAPAAGCADAAHGGAAPGQGGAGSCAATQGEPGTPTEHAEHRHTGFPQSGATATKDPVCGMSVNEAAARASGKVADHQGKSYFFCSDSCRTRFQGAPEKFADAGPTGVLDQGAVGPHDHGGHPPHGTLHAQAGTRP